MLPVLIRPGKLGDVVLLGAVSAALGECVVATNRRYHGIASRLTGVRRVIELDAVRQESGALVDLQGSLRSRWLCRGRAHRTIHKRSLRRRLWLHTGHPAAPRPTVPELYAEAAGVRPAPLPWIGLPSEPRTTLGLAPGAAFGPKRWAAERFAAVGRAWSGPVTVFGGPGEQALVSAVAGAIPGARALAESGFDATLAALPALAAMVAGDTGLMHIAGAAGVPVVALFGPTHPADGFWVYRGAVVQRDLRCRPCALHRVERCRVGHHGCMDSTPEAVLRAIASTRAPSS